MQIRISFLPAGGGPRFGRSIGSTKEESTDALKDKNTEKIATEVRLWIGQKEARLNTSAQIDAVAAVRNKETIMATKKTVSDLLEDEVKDLYSAEKQLTKAIPKMAKGSKDSSLQEAFKGHLAETQNQVKRLEEVAQLLGIKPTGKKCMGMEGVIKEGAEALEEEGDETILDIGIVGAGCRVEHYEIAGYTTAIMLANKLGAKDVVSLLQQSLAEEQAAGRILEKIGGDLLKRAPVRK